MDSVYARFVDGLRHTGALEYTAVATGIGSVFFSRIENILVYPVGIISTLIYIYISFYGGLYAEAGLNIYYTLMSLIGWWMWARRGASGEKLVITRCTGKDWMWSVLFFAGMWLALWFVLKTWTPSTVPIADGFASAAAYTGMLLMNKKKTENWLWWILTNLASVPLYFIKGYVFTSVQFAVLLVLAIWGWVTWEKKLQHARAAAIPADEKFSRKI